MESQLKKLSLEFFLIGADTYYLPVRMIVFLKRTFSWL